MTTMKKSITPPDDYLRREQLASQQVRDMLDTLRSEKEIDNWTFDVGCTTAMEFEIEQITGLQVPENLLKKAKKQNRIAKSQIKAEQKPLFLGKCVAGEGHFNWEDEGMVTEVRDQGACGSCWAFATHGAYEGSNAILNKSLVDSAEQDTLDCSGAGSCGGGWWAFQYLIDTGVADEADYPYEASQETCKVDMSRPYKALTWGYVDSTTEIPSVDAIKKALCEYGPLAVAVEVTPAFQAYTSGVFNQKSTGGVNHGVTLVGWNDEEEAWRIKNSWGKGWGDSGFMWIAYDSNSIGYAAAWTQAEPTSECDDGSCMLASEEFYYIDDKQFDRNANVASVTFNLPQEMAVSITADASAAMIEGRAPTTITTGLYTSESPNAMWTASYRKATFLGQRQHIPVITSHAIKLSAGTHTVYWKIWPSRGSIKFDSGTLKALAVPCSMGGKLQLQSARTVGDTSMAVEDQGVITTRDVGRPDLLVSIDRSTPSD